MPTYQYRCADCSNELEVVQSFTDDALTVCPTCDGDLRKVFSAAAVVFKGSGFYATDNRPKNGASAAKAATKTPPSAPTTPASTTPSAPADKA